MSVNRYLLLGFIPAPLLCLRLVLARPPSCVLSSVKIATMTAKPDRLSWPLIQGDALELREQGELLRAAWWRFPG